MKSRLSSLFIAALAFACTLPAAADPAQLGDSVYFAKVGRTVFVSGLLSRWAPALSRVLPLEGGATETAAYAATPVDTIVFVNSSSRRPEKTGDAILWSKRLAKFGIRRMVVIGTCDLECARIFASGQTREFGQTIFGKAPRVEIQLPYDLQVGQLERRFPNSQLAVFETALPSFTARNKDLLTLAFTKPNDETGGLFIGPEGVKYCSSQKAGTCQDYADLTAFNMGLTTSPDRVSVQLPDGFGVK